MDTAAETVKKLAEECEFMEKRLAGLNAKGGPERGFMALVDGGPGVGPVSVSNMGFIGDSLLRFWGTNQDKETVQVVMHINQLRFSLRVVRKDQVTEKRPIGFGDHSDQETIN